MYYDQTLLEFSILANEASQDARERVDIFEFVLQLFGKKKAWVAVKIGDNANVNRALAR